jgi:hypothetical protein
MNKTNKPNKIERENVLAVEGKDEHNFFEALLKFLDFQDVQIIDVGGKDNFKGAFSALIQTEGALNIMRNIGFVRDAEEHEAQSAFDSICSVLSGLKEYNIPCPPKSCEVFEEMGKKVGVFIMPNNKDRGMLEDLCIKSIESTDIYHCVKCFEQCYGEKIDKAKYNESKAIILAYLSTRVPIVNALGLAARQNVWDFSHPFSMK